MNRTYRTCKTYGTRHQRYTSHKSYRSYKSYSYSWRGVIAFLSPYGQRRQPSRGVDADFDLAPLAVALFVEGGVADAVLMTQRQRNARDRVFQFGVRRGEKGHAAGRAGEFFQD